MSNQYSSKSTLQIIEWQNFSSSHIEDVIGDKTKAERIFEELIKFASEEDNRRFITITKGGKALKARNYVGLIQTNSGFCLEILPKIYDKHSLDKRELENTKTLLIQMLKTLKNFPCKTSNLSNLDTIKASLLEIFIHMFLNELIVIIKKGIKSNYHSMEENRFYLKGKLLFSQHIKCNLIHQERFYTCSDEYSPNIPQNRLIKSTLVLFSKMPLSVKAQNLLLQCRFAFDDVPPSSNIDEDFRSCYNNRSLKHYEIILAWSKIFLKQKNFTSYAGNSVAIALLFDMNDLFESYIAYHFKRHCEDWNIRIQDSGKYLLINGDKDFCGLRPDIVAEKGHKTIVLDTKWKEIKEQKDIAVSDIHQMWAYASKYNSKKVILIYPKIGNFQGETNFTFKPENLQGSCLEIIFVDLTLENKEYKIKEIPREVLQIANQRE